MTTKNTILYEAVKKDTIMTTQVASTSTSLQTALSGQKSSGQRHAGPVVSSNTTSPPNAALWAKLQGMSIDPQGASTTFIHRLREKTKLEDEKAKALQQEYLRFLYLAATVDHAITPSKLVDEAWHLHLIYTRHYWKELCPNILGRPFHHEPSAGGDVEHDKFDDQYVRTLKAYEAAFGCAPPTEFWPQLVPRQKPASPLVYTLPIAPFALFSVGALSVIPTVVFALVGWGVAHAMRHPDQKSMGGSCGTASSGGHNAAAGCGGPGGDGGGSCGGGGCGGGCGG
jgi:uncharacterized membrane protein YgcG